MRQGRETTQEERLEIVKDCIANGKNYGAMAVKYEVGCPIELGCKLLRVARSAYHKWASGKMTIYAMTWASM